MKTAAFSADIQISELSFSLIVMDTGLTDELRKLFILACYTNTIIPSPPVVVVTSFHNTGIPYIVVIKSQVCRSKIHHH